jgi:predicted acylesterase/phospholipase RssA
VKRARHEVDCVIGTSFGALAGSMYATAPSEYVPDRYLAFMDAYVTRTRADKEQGFLGGLVIGGLIGAATGGIGLAIGALGGGQLGAEAVYERDRKRFVNVLHEFYGGAVIERLPVRFATLYQERATYGLRPRRVQIGDLSNAVGASAANPLIFQDVNVRADQAIDPGVDRVAAVPVEDACQLFPRAALIAINVTDQAAFFSGAMRCPLLEVRVPLQQEDVQALTRGPKFDAYVKAGFDATAQALAANP